MKQINRFDLDGNLIKTYKSQTEAVKDLRILNPQRLMNALRTGSKYHDSYWEVIQNESVEG